MTLQICAHSCWLFTIPVFAQRSSVIARYHKEASVIPFRIKLLELLENLTLRVNIEGRIK